jgi:hypothetical protein
MGIMQYNHLPNEHQTILTGQTGFPSGKHCKGQAFIWSIRPVIWVYGCSSTA